MAYNIDALSDECYPGTSCLINKFDIHNDKDLATQESEITTIKSAMIIHTPPSPPFDFNYYKSIHRFLFEDIYSWAGTTRKVNLSKRGTQFAQASEIDSCATACFAKISTISFSNFSHHEIACQVADLYNTVNMLHPFREGNGRTQRVFFTIWLRHFGCDIDFSVIDADQLMIATIHAAQGIIFPLEDFFDKHLIFDS